MTRKEKAKEIMDFYDEHCWISPTDNQVTVFHKTQCALFCINQIISSIESISNNLDVINDEVKWDINNIDVSFWKQVKDEIIALS